MTELCTLSQYTSRINVHHEEGFGISAVRFFSFMDLLVMDLWLLFVTVPVPQKKKKKIEIERRDWQISNLSLPFPWAK